MSAKDKLAGCVVLAILLIAAGWFGWRASRGKAPATTVISTPMPNPWKSVTKPRDMDCKTNCQELAVRAGAHGGPVKLLLHDTDDEVYQWGSCFTSVLKCAESKGVNALSICVAQSECPQQCKEQYSLSARDANTPDALFKNFEAVFINEGAPCRPLVSNKAVP